MPRRRALAMDVTEALAPCLMPAEQCRLRPTARAPTPDTSLTEDAEAAAAGDGRLGTRALLDTLQSSAASGRQPAHRRPAHVLDGGCRAAAALAMDVTEALAPCLMPRRVVPPPAAKARSMERIAALATGNHAMATLPPSVTPWRTRQLRRSRQQRGGARLGASRVDRTRAQTLVLACPRT